MFMILQTATCTFNVVDFVMSGITIQYVMRYSGQGLSFLHALNWNKSIQDDLQKSFNMLDIPQEKEQPEEVVETDSQWPANGNIEFKDAKLRYRPTTDLVLKGLDFSIQGGHKVGIVGRTGAGKSTLSLALTRIVELDEGSI